jgi:hypothetical protein
VETGKQNPECWPARLTKARNIPVIERTAGRPQRALVHQLGGPPATSSQPRLQTAGRSGAPGGLDRSRPGLHGFPSSAASLWLQREPGPSARTRRHPLYTSPYLEKTFWIQEKVFPPRKCSILPGKDLWGLGKGLFLRGNSQFAQEKTFWAAEKPFESRNCSILPGKDLLPGSGSHSDGELTQCRQGKVFSSFLLLNSDSKKSFGLREKSLTGWSQARLKGQGGRIARPSSPVRR